MTPVRVCTWPGCDTRLSRYNAGTVCGVHEGSGDPWRQLDGEERIGMRFRLEEPLQRVYRSGAWLK
jgi:hypothetical protein